MKDLITSKRQRLIKTDWSGVKHIKVISVKGMNTLFFLKGINSGSSQFTAKF